MGEVFKLMDSFNAKIRLPGLSKGIWPPYKDLKIIPLKAASLMALPIKY